jgi:hypothetical protein
MSYSVEEILQNSVLITELSVRKNGPNSIESSLPNDRGIKPGDTLELRGIPEHDNLYILKVKPSQPEVTS